jgi:hypothetical protein
LVALLAGACVARAADQPKATEPTTVTVWGKPRDGLQAGIRVASDKQSLSEGDAAEFKIVVRNVSDEVVVIQCLPGIYLGKSDKSTVDLRWGHVYGGFLTPHTWFQFRLAPGEEFTRGELAIRHAGPKADTGLHRRWTDLVPGKYQVGSEQVEMRIVADPVRGLPADLLGRDLKLGTGYLDIELLKPRK